MKKKVLIFLLVSSVLYAEKTGEFHNRVSLNLGKTMSEDSKNYVNNDLFGPDHGVDYNLFYSLTPKWRVGLEAGVDFQSLDGGAKEDIKFENIKNGKIGLIFERTLFEGERIRTYWNVSGGALKGEVKRKIIYTHGFYRKTGESDFTLSSNYYLKLSVGAEYDFMNFSLGVERKSYTIKEVYRKGYYSDEYTQEGINNVTAFISFGIHF